MKKNFTIRERSKGELAIRECSQKAKDFFNSGYEITVYAVRVPSEDIQITGDEKGDEFVTRYFTRGDYANQDNMTLAELDALLCDLEEKIDTMLCDLAGIDE